jgi:beta-glucosidase
LEINVKHLFRNAIRLLAIGLLIALSVPVLAQQSDIPPSDAPYKNPQLAIEERVNDLLARMTVAEKIGQMTQVEKNSIKMEDIDGLFIGSLLSGGAGSPADNSVAGWAKMVDDFQTQALKTRLAIPLIYGADGVHGHNNLKGSVIFHIT